MSTGQIDRHERADGRDLDTAGTGEDRYYGAFVIPPSDLARAQGASTGALAGQRVPIKDNIDVAGLPTRAGSAATSAEPVTSDATVVARLRAAGAVLDAKTALDEFALTTSGPGMQNPHDPARTVGGSSGGAALAVATGVSEVAVGSDTGGSVRIPAAYCGAVGFKPTYGSIPLTGVVPLSWSLDHVGLLGHRVRNVVGVFDVCRDGRPGRRPGRRPWPRCLQEIRVGVAGETFLAAAAPDVADAVAATATALAAVGARLGSTDLPLPPDVLESHYPIAIAEAAAYHATAYADLSRHGTTVREFINDGLEISAADYLRARHRIGVLRGAMDLVFDAFDAVLLPTTPTTAPTLGEDDVRLGDGSLVSRLDASIWYTALFNDIGSPAISLPIPTDGMPIGIQLVAAADDDDLLLALAVRVEELLYGPTSDGQAA